MIIVIEGNIGAGKSEVLASLQKHLANVLAPESIEFFPEPLDQWGDTLQLYFKNKKKWAALLALDILRAFGDVPASKARHQIVERSPDACRHVFCELDKHAGHVSKDEMAIVDQYYDLYGWVPDLVLHLEVNDAVCCDRIEGRGRPGEDTLTYELIRAISFQYEKMYKTHMQHVPIIRCVQSVSEDKDAFHARLAYLVLRAIQDHEKKHGLQHNQTGQHFHGVHDPPEAKPQVLEQGGSHVPFFEQNFDPFDGLM